MEKNIQTKIFICENSFYLRCQITLMEQIELTLAEKIDRALDGRTQASVVQKMVAKGIETSEYHFSRKKKGYLKFTEKELKALSEILGTEITND